MADCEDNNDNAIHVTIRKKTELLPEDARAKMFINSSEVVKMCKNNSGISTIKGKEAELI